MAHAACFAALTLLSGCNQRAEGRKSASGALLSGVIRDVKGQPLSGVTLSLRRVPLGAPPFLTTLSDAQGQYALRADPGDYVLEGRRPGYASESRGVALGGRLPRSRDLTLSSSGSLTGRVRRRSDGAPVPGAKIRALPDSTRSSSAASWLTVRCDARGAFELTDLSPGVVALFGQGPELSSREPTLFAIDSAEQVTNADVWVDAAFAVSGQVTTSADSRPDFAAGMQLLAIERGNGRSASEPTVVDGTGHFTIHDLAPGTYQLRALGGHEPRILDGAGITVIDQDVHAQHVTLERGQRVSGTVTPASRAELHLRALFADAARDEAPIQLSATTETGAFAFDEVPRGRFLLLARTAAGASSESVITVGADVPKPISLQLRPARSVFGRLTDERGRAIADARLEFASVGSNAPAAHKPHVEYVETNREGNFELRASPPGAYEVTLYDRFGARGWLDAANAERAAPKRTTVPASQLSAPFFVHAARCTGVVRGTVADANDRPLPFARLSLRRSASEGNSLLTLGTAERHWFSAHADGSFEVRELCKASYRIDASSVSGALSSAQDGLSENAELRLNLRPSPDLVGRVRRNGVAISRYQLELGGPMPRSTSIQAADGRYRLSALEPGLYEVFVSSDDGYALETVEVTADTIEHDFELLPWSSLSGRIVDRSPSGCLGIGVEAVLEPLGGEALDLIGPALRVQHADVNERCEFSFPKLSAGRGYLAFRRAGAALFVADQTYTLRRTSQRGPSPWLTFVLGPGQPTALGEVRILP